jgi:DNA-binding transcriptional regulator YiaG
MGKRVAQKSKQEFAARLKRWRRSNEFSQSDAAEFLSVPVSTLQNWEIARTMPTGVAHTILTGVFSKDR